MLEGIGFRHIALVLVVYLIFFGAKRLPGIMKDLAKGYRAFADGLKECSHQEEENSPKRTLSSGTASSSCDEKKKEL